MKLPVDVKAVIDAATDIEGARNTPVSVSVIIDDTAPGDVTAFVRSTFASAGAHARVTIGYFGGAVFEPYAGDDMAVIVAGVAEDVGRRAAEIRGVGVPVMVVTTMPDLVSDMASAFGHPIPEGDLLAPAAQGEAGAASVEPIELDDERAEGLSLRMGEWVVETCRAKRLAFALAFPFVRRPLSIEAVRATSVQNAGIGLVAFIPGADLPIMTLNQAKMLLQIAAAYGEPMGAARAKELAAVVAGGFAMRSVARQVAALVPVVGWAVKAAVGYGGTQAMGHAAIEYFERGGNFAGLAGVVGTAREEVVRAAGAVAATPAGARAIDAAKRALKTGASMAFGKN